MVTPVTSHTYAAHLRLEWSIGTGETQCLSDRFAARKRNDVANFFP